MCISPNELSPDKRTLLGPLPPQPRGNNRLLFVGLAIGSGRREDCATGALRPTDICMGRTFWPSRTNNPGAHPRRWGYPEFDCRPLSDTIIRLQLGFRDSRVNRT